VVRAINNDSGSEGHIAAPKSSVDSLKEKSRAVQEACFDWVELRANVTSGHGTGSIRFISERAMQSQDADLLSRTRQNQLASREKRFGYRER